MLRSPLFLLIGQSFFFGLTLSLLVIPASALFLDAFGSERLPYTYIAVALLGAGLASTLAALQRRWSLSRLATGTSLLLAAILFLSWAALLLAAAAWLSFVLLVLFALYLQIGFVFLGGQAGRLFEVRQIKRLFPRVVSGFAVGFLAGGLLAVPLVPLVGRTEHLLLATTASTLMLLLLQAMTGRRFADELATPEQGAGGGPRVPMRHLLTRRFVLLIFLYQILSAVASQLLDFMVFDQAARRFAGSEALAQFVGNYTWILNLVDILFLSLLAGYLLSRFGLRFGLAANPADVALLLLAMLAAGVLQGTGSSAFFLLVLAARISDIALTDGATRTSLNAAYQALPPAERLAVQTGVEGIGVPLALGIAGGILLLFNAIPALTPLHLVLLTLVVTLGWLGAAFLVYREYGANLLRVLKRRHLAPVELTIADASTLAVVERLARSDVLRDVRLGLDLLRDGGRDREYVAHLIDLVQSPRADHQIEALGRIEAGALHLAVPALEQVVARETNPLVRGRALRSAAALAPGGDPDRLVRHLDDPEEAVRFEAMVALLRYGGAAGREQIEPRLHQMAAAADATERERLADLLRESEMRRVDALLEPLLRDEQVAVRRAALAAVTPERAPALLPHVAAALDDPATRSAAVTVLTRAPVDLLPLLAAALEGERPRRAERLLRLCRRRACPDAAPLLLGHLDHPDRALRAQILATLAAGGYRAGGAAREKVDAAIRAEAAYALRALAARVDLGEAPALEPLLRGLADEAARAVRLLFGHLALRYDPRALDRAADHLREGSREERALALEMLEVTLAPDLQRLVLPLVEPAWSDEQRIEALAAHLPLVRQSREAWLREISRGEDGAWPSSWLRGCGCAAARHLGLALDCEEAGGDVMLQTIERVSILNRVDPFAGTPDDLLAAVATILEEVALSPGEMFIEDGAVEACMYIVVEGEVRVHHHEQTIITLGPGNTVGELAVLDPAPRSASVSAVGPVLLFRLDKGPFDEVMADRPEIAQGVIRTLARRLRAQGRLAGQPLAAPPSS